MKQNTKYNFSSMLQNNFTAIGLSEGDRDMARDFLKNEPESSLWKSINEAYTRIQNHFVAAGLAEECSDTAKRYMEQNLDSSKKSYLIVASNKLKHWIQQLEQAFFVAGLAEGDPKLARTYLKSQETPKTVGKQSLKDFLATTGLKDAPFQYGLMAA